MARSPLPKQTLPLVLMGAGLVILATNMGGLDLARLARLWPLLAIAVGVNILSGGRYRALLMLATPLLMLFLYTSSAPGGGGAARTETLTYPLGGAQNAEIQLQVGVSDLRLDTSGDPGQLLAGTVAMARGERLIQDVDRRGDTARITLRSARRGASSVSGGDRRAWNLSLSPALPLALTVETGVGRGVLELAEAQLTRLEVSTGVGQTHLVLPRRGRYEATLETGVGAATVQLPRGLAARVEVSRGVGALTVRGDFVRDGERYTTPDYGAADHQVDLRVDGGVGAITIEQLD